MAIDYNNLSEIFKALGHPVRLRMVEGLSCNECNVNKMVKKLALPQSTVSQHLAILRRCGVIVMRKDGVKTCYTVGNKRVSDMIKALKG